MLDIRLIRDDPARIEEALADKGVTAISLDTLPRTLSRAQTMDALSSQANVGGYKAVLMAAAAYGRYFPLLTTAAGTAKPANVLVLGVGAASAVYGVRYLAAETGHGPVAGTHLLTALEIAALALVVTARSAMPFLIAWEIMAVLAYFLVVFERGHAEVRRAGLIYLICTHTGTLALIALFASWGQRAGTLSFDALAAVSPSLPLGGALVFALGLVGFGFKAGVIPLHFWLPGAHGAAPSHVSALMSGVVIKMGIYGLLRLVTLAGPPPAWWGWLVLALGVVSGVFGVLWALAQHDLKRLLAYHSVENIGIILLGLGIGALGVRYDAPLIAALGFAGAVLHTLNHALFKSLLFLGAGAVLRATGTRMIDRLGGLGRRMPLTWATFLVGSIAIVGLPPLNGFVSEWLVYQGLLRSGTLAPARAAVFAVAGLALIGALALACFAKVGGAVFLGHPRTAEARHGAEVRAGLLAPMWALALACVVTVLVTLTAQAVHIGPSTASDARLWENSRALMSAFAHGVRTSHARERESGAFPQDAARGVLRVCADPNNLPFSNERGEGFENRLAEMVAADLGVSLQYAWWPQRRGFVRKGEKLARRPIGRLSAGS